MRAVLLVLVASCTGQPPPPAAPMPQQWAQPGGAWFCTALHSPAATGSVCFALPERCEHERRTAEADGVRAAVCLPQAPVACFQLHDDPNPSLEMCAATVPDCDLLRLIDQDKNRRTGAACEWRHGDGLPR